MAGDARLGLTARASDGEGDFGAGRHIHFGAHRAHLGDEADQPADLGVGFGIFEPLLAGPWREHQEAGPPARPLGELCPKLLGDEGHEGMEQEKRAVEDEGGHGARLLGSRLVASGQDRLDQLEIPVAVDMPDEVIDGAGRLVEAEGFERFGHGGCRPLALAGDPAIDGKLGRAWREIASRPTAIDLRKPRRVPQLGGEVAVALHAAVAQLDVAPLRRHGGESELSASAPYLSISSRGSITFPFDFDIFWPFSSRTSAWI